MSILTDIATAIQKGKNKAIPELIQTALDEGIAPQTILDEGLLAGMDVIGDKFKRNEAYVPEVLVAARAMKTGTDILKPLLADSDAKPLGKVIIGTVKGDMHDIGKNLVRMMMEGKGITVIDLGVDVSKEAFLEAFQREDAQIVALSALLTTTMTEMKDIIDHFTENGVRDKVKFMIGGAPITDAYRQSIGADYYTADAATASDVAKAALLAA